MNDFELFGTIKPKKENELIQPLGKEALKQKEEHLKNQLSVLIGERVEEIPQYSSYTQLTDNKGVLIDIGSASVDEVRSQIVLKLAELEKEITKLSNEISFNEDQAKQKMSLAEEAEQVWGDRADLHKIMYEGVMVPINDVIRMQKEKLTRLRKQAIPLRVRMDFELSGKEDKAFKALKAEAERDCGYKVTTADKLQALKERRRVYDNEKFLASADSNQSDIDLSIGWYNDFIQPLESRNAYIEGMLKHKKKLEQIRSGKI